MQMKKKTKKVIDYSKMTDMKYHLLPRVQSVYSGAVHSVVGSSIHFRTVPDDPMGTSYTDGKTITLGIQSDVLKMIPTHEEQVNMHEGIIYHEDGHILFTDFKSYTTFLKTDFPQLFDKNSKWKKNMSKHVAVDFMQNLVNLLEDGRMENLVNLRYPGVINKLDYVNFHYYFAQDFFSDLPEYQLDELVFEPDIARQLIEQVKIKYQFVPSDDDDTSKGDAFELHLFNTMLWSYIKLRKYFYSAPVFVYLPEYERVFSNFKLVRDLLKKSLIAKNTRELISYATEIFELLFDYLADLLKEKTDLEDMLNQMKQLGMAPDDFSAAAESTVDSETLKRAGVDANKNFIGEPTDSKSGSSNQKKNSSDTEAPGEGKSDESYTTDNSGTNKNNQSGTGMDSKDKDDSEDTNASNTMISEKNEFSFEEEGSEPVDMSAEDLIDKLLKDAKGSNDGSDVEERKAIWKSSKDSKKRYEEMKKLSDSDRGNSLSKIEKLTNRDEIEKARIEGSRISVGDASRLTLSGRRFTRLEIDKQNYPYVPQEAVRKTRLLRKQIEQLIATKSPMTLRNQQTGRLDVRSLYKAGMNDSNLFMRQNHPVNSSWAIGILIDHSGSMSGDKIEAAHQASIELEELLKGLVPLKITGFTNKYSYSSFRVQRVF